MVTHRLLALGIAAVCWLLHQAASAQVETEQPNTTPTTEASATSETPPAPATTTPVPATTTAPAPPTSAAAPPAGAPLPDAPSPTGTAPAAAAPSDSATAPTTGFLSRIVVPDAAKEAVEGWAKLNYTDLANIVDAQFSMKINGPLMESTADRGEDEESHALKLLQIAAGADAVLRKKDTSWELLRADTRGGLDLIGNASGDLAASLVVHQILGYDGVVIAQKGRIVLAQTPDLSDQKDLYAVSLGDSAGIFAIKDDKGVTRSALLRLLGGKKVSGHGTISRFQVISSEKAEPLPFGTKLRIEHWQ